MKPMAAMNVIPVIDIMLVLLAVVLTTATFVAQGRIPVNLPPATQAEQLPAGRHVEIAVSDDGSVHVDGIAQTADALVDSVAAIAAGTPLLLRVDEAVAFRHFVRVIDVLKAHQLDNVSIVASRAGP